MNAAASKSHPDEIQRRLYDSSFCILAARFNSDVVDLLVDGARAALVRNGVAESAIDLVHVAGAFELPLAAQAAARTERYDGLIVLGAVIRGGTPHFEFISGECMSGLTRVALDTGVPIGNGVLTVDTVQQAMDRAGGSEGNKGDEAALAAMELVHVLRDLN